MSADHLAMMSAGVDQDILNDVVAELIASDCDDIRGVLTNRYAGGTYCR